MLRDAGVQHITDSAHIDEAAIKRRARDSGQDVERTAMELAIAKAKAICARHPGAYVIGADQILECDGEWFDKPTDGDGIKDHLTRLRGRTHSLVSAVTALRDGRVLWQHVEIARLSMRPLSDDFIARYRDAAGPEVCDSVGAYRLEDTGAQLFKHIQGDYFTILGLPLLPLLAFLRKVGVLPTQSRWTGGAQHQTLGNAIDDGFRRILPSYAQRLIVVPVCCRDRRRRQGVGFSSGILPDRLE